MSFNFNIIVANLTAQDFWNRYDFAYNEEEVPQTLAAMIEVPEPNWYVDTNATAHGFQGYTQVSEIDFNEIFTLVTNQL